MSEDRSSWQVKGSSILSELVSLMDLSSDEAAMLKSLSAEAQNTASTMTASFYERLFKHENTAEYLKGKPMERLHSMVGEWFTELFSGNYDEQYVQKRLTIGEIHVRIGLPVRYPLSMVDVIMQFGESVAQTSSDPVKASAAFRKVLALDVAIFNQAYEDNQLNHLSDLVGGERLARRLLSGSV